MYQLVGGYEDANDSNVLRHDPIFKIACERLPSTKAVNKRYADWGHNKETAAFLALFSSDPDYEGLEAIITIEGRSGGTWGHPGIAIQFAQWCSPGFALQVSRWLRQWLRGKRPSAAELENMNEKQIKYDLQRAKTWYKMIDCYLSQIRETAMFEAVKFQQQEMDLEDEGEAI